MRSVCVFFFSSRRRHTRCSRDWSSDVCSSDLLLPVSAPFHCDLMAPARERLARDLSGLRLHDARFPVIVNVTARPETGAEVLRRSLLDQVTSPVRWVESVLRMKELRVDALVEVGPGRVLSGLAKRIVPDIPLFNIEDPASLRRAGEAIGPPPGVAA